MKNRYVFKLFLKDRFIYLIEAVSLKSAIEQFRQMDHIGCFR